MQAGPDPASVALATVASEPAASSLSAMTRPVHSLVRRAPVMLPADTSILQVAQTMRDQRVSSVLLMAGEALVGLVTDRDLRNRVLAAGLDPARPVHEIATLAPLTVPHSAPAFDALLLMRGTTSTMCRCSMASG